ncbi:TonB-dependent receptor plug domain-containing protein [Paraglaciecola arctica]|uniref:TonB-dependent receptor n=1 Tax=Paraglaciecola arctica BSs20135 TaxID=493475 RepID=K6YRS6_9ALTE|nr:TonB-dependent receptor [Paraglaciecola arctica]GAC19373.1 hypothetical protein GARC_2407 [Paraglaciecola arctica BSs20135]
MNFNMLETPKARRSLLAVTIGAAFATTTLGSFAQEAQVESNTPNDLEERIQVTGSRITRTTFDAPTPTVVVSAADIKISGAVNINDLLTTMPQFGEGLDSTTGNYSFGNAGLNTLNLRSLGTNRTLVLVNGKRMVPISDDAQNLYSDVGMIPSELVERIEILTGGASAVYGSDAVAGVVNFVLKKDYQGTSVRGQVGASEDGGGSSRNITITHGLNFDDDRGNFSFSVDFLNESALTQRDRRFSNASMRSVGNPRNTGPNDGIPDNIATRDATSVRWGGDAPTYSIWNNEYNERDWFGIDENGNPFKRTNASNTYAGWLSEDRGGFENKWGNIEDPFERLMAYAQVAYSFDKFDLVADVNYVKAESRQEIDPPFVYGDWWNISDMEALGWDIPTAVAEHIRTADAGWTDLHLTMYEAGPRWHETERESLVANLTLSGHVNDNWTWDANFTSGRSDSNLLIGNELRNDRFNDSTFSLVGPCVDNGSCPEYKGYFDRPSQAVLDYVLDEHFNTTEVVNHAFSANVAGDLYDLPAGVVQMSAGYEVRYESLDYKPSELWQSGNISSSQQPMDGSRTIHEAYAETLIPVFADQAFAKSLDLEFAIRKAEYSTEASSFTSAKAGINWSINDELRFRSTYSSAVRAPQLGELFGGESVGFQSYNDPCDRDNISGGPADGRRKDNCALLGIVEDGWESNIRTITGKTITAGNPDLKEENAKTLTAGLIYQPSYVEGLRFSLDYFDIKLEDMISQFGAGAMLSNCVDLTPGSVDNAFCDQTSRVTSGENIGDVNFVKPADLNADQGRRRGLDIEADYSINNFRFKAVATRQYEDSLTQRDYASGDNVYENEIGELAIPKWAGKLISTYSEGEFSASWTYNFRQGGRWNDDASAELYETDHPGNSNVHHLRASYNLTDKANVYVGINNLTDENGGDHWTTSRGSILGWASIGRNYYAGIIYDF